MGRALAPLLLALALPACGGAPAPSSAPPSAPPAPPCASLARGSRDEPPTCTSEGPGDGHAHDRRGYGDGRVHGGGPGAGPGSIHMCVMGSGPLPATVRASVERALVEERDAELVYEAALATLGDVGPLRPIARAERRHSVAIERLLQAHGHPVPPREERAVAGPRDLAEACRGGVTVEKKNIAFYDKELAATLPSDVACVFEHLQHASRDHHLPAFERCAPK